MELEKNYQFVPGWSMCQSCIEIARTGDDNSEISEEEEMQIDDEIEEAKNENYSTELSKSLDIVHQSINV